VVGTIFDHKSETPGLGAEINTKAFQAQFLGKKIFDEQGKFISIAVVKGGTAPDNQHGVDAISGGTITSKGVEKMLFDNLSSYEAFFKKHIQL
jgi:Na+-transporting NADH:ubiquinone oxidoreductase subunit C